MKYKRMKMKNTDILSAGSKVYEKKRRMKKETVESIDFDFDKRHEFLTGFHKRKLERKQVARDKYKEKERQERIKFRAENKAERQREVETRMAEIAAALKGDRSDNDDDDEDETVFTDGEDNDDKDDTKKPKVKEFKSAKSLTTVTVIEDLDLGEESD
ncbi:nucleolar protein 12-domain-containing protein [Chlamydoabsidia padenii]|nr:nucleolar protein 12-domain-containing protein [Chlamydoabsidia padenii]